MGFRSSCHTTHSYWLAPRLPGLAGGRSRSFDGPDAQARVCEPHIGRMAIVVGRIMKAAASAVGTPWMWTLIFDYHEDRSPTYGYEATREAAMAAFAAKSWRRE
jgi:hypothetical protein